MWPFSKKAEIPVPFSAIVSVPLATAGSLDELAATVEGLRAELHGSQEAHGRAIAELLARMERVEICNADYAALTAACKVAIDDANLPTLPAIAKSVLSHYDTLYSLGVAVDELRQGVQAAKDLAVQADQKAQTVAMRGGSGGIAGIA